MRCFYIYIPLAIGFCLHGMIFLNKRIALYRDVTISGRVVKQSIVSFSLLSSMSGCFWSVINAGTDHFLLLFVCFY